MMKKKKAGRVLLSFLLSLAMVIGFMPGMGMTAHAAPTEVLLTTITATGTARSATSENVIYSTGGVATLSFSGSVSCNSSVNWGWWGNSWSATVNAAEGYTITKCVFYDDKDRTATDSEAPFVVETTEEDKTPKVNGAPILAYQSKGITKIEVYGYATPTTVDVTGVSLNKTTTTLTVGDTETLTANVSPDDATDKSVTWSCDNESVATVDNNGKVTAVAAGTATITATATNGTDDKSDDKTATCAVTVASAAHPISYTVTFKVANGSWDDGTTSDKSVTLSGMEGDTLKLSSGQIPAVGTKPNDGYKAGSWDVTPSTDTPISSNVTYTYTYVADSSGGTSDSGSGDSSGGSSDSGSGSSSSGSTDSGSGSSSSGSSDSGNTSGGTATTGTETTPQTPTTESYTIPVESEQAVQVDASITQGTATVSDITQAQIEQATTTTGDKEKTADTITIDLTGAKQDVSAVELTKITVDKLAETTASENNINTVTVALTNASAEFDSAALDAISKEAKTGEKVTISVDEKKTSDLSNEQQTALKEVKVEKVISASVKAGSTQLHTFGGGSVKMTVKNEIKDNRNKNYFHVYYIDPLGQLIRFITEHTGLDALYRTDHFSDYVIVYDESDMNENIAPITGGVVKGLTYNKKTQTVELESVKADAVDGARALVPDEAYTISGKTKVKNAGTYTLTITAKEGSGYRGSAEVTYDVEKANQQMAVKAKKVEVAAGTTKLSAKKAFTVKKAVGKVTYKKLSGSKKLSVSKSGELKIKKGSKAGKYILTLRVKAKGNKNYKAKSTKVKLTVIVK